MEEERILKKNEIVFSDTLGVCQVTEISSLTTKKSDRLLEIGFQRLGHSGGRFYVADIFEAGGKTVLCGEVKDVYPSHSQSKAKRYIDTVGSYLLEYCLLVPVSVLLWLCIFQFQHIWLPLLLPIPILTLFRILAKKDDKKTDSDFIEFMSIFSAYTDAKAASCEPCWDDVYRRLYLACGELHSICDGGEDMLRISYEDGMQIDVGYSEKDTAYCITVVQENTAAARNHPLGVFMTNDKSKLPAALQKVICKFRNA